MFVGTLPVVVNMVDTQCPADLFQCESGECVHWVYVCDGEDDCLDASDESCAHSSYCIMHNSFIKLKENENRTFKG